jgi:hypothetical protein
MNSELFSSETPHQTLRAECEHLTEKAFVEGSAALTTLEHQRLQELWSIFPELKHEFDAMNLTIQRVNATYSNNNERSEEQWNSLENRIITRVQGARDSEVASTTITQPKLTLVQNLRRYGWSVARIAAVFVVGLFAGHFAPILSSSSNNATSFAFRQNDTFQTMSFRPSVEQEAMQAYLKDAHLLMLGVMAMNAECGVSNPHTLSSQRERCVELLSRSQRVQAGLSASERVRVARVMNEIESALAEFADVQPASCNASTIRQLQKRTDYALCEVSSALNEHEVVKQ